MSFDVVSLFAGCGGSSTGYVMAGGKVLLAVEWDDNAVATYKANYPDTPVYHGDIGKLTIDEILKITGLKPGELDILDGSPPCQGFSTAGKRDFCDTRNQLFREYVRILQGLKPKVFVMENVSGMVKGKMKLIFAEILRELKGSGYRVKARLMNAMYYGVPQSRQRMIFVGVREDIGIEPTHPNPQTRPIPVSTILSDIKRAYFTSGFNKGDEIDLKKPCPTLMKGDIAGSSFSQLKMECGSPLSKWEMERWNKIKPGEGFDKIDKTGFSMRKIDPDKPSNTIPKSLAFGGHSYLYHPTEPRGLSIEEIKLIHTYPESYIFLGKFEDKWARIGNSVPPLLTKAVAEHIDKNILQRYKDTFPGKEIKKIE
jgi:DNA (cytosine-5)-methyltransferase 1